MLQGELWEVRCQKNGSPKKSSNPFRSFKVQGFFGDRIHAVWLGGDDPRNMVEKVLREAGVEIQSMRKIARAWKIFLSIP